MLEIVKLALRVSGDDYDEQLNMLIAAAKEDMAVAGVDPVDETDPLVQVAICTYCTINFGFVEDADRLKRAYDEQKAQLSMSTGYTDWLEVE